MDYSIVIPVFNEENNVEPLADEIHEALSDRMDFEVIFVDDGSTDETPARLGAVQRKFRHTVRVLHHSERCGQSAALLVGARFARAPWIVTLDGDGQDDPHEIPKLVEVLKRPSRASRLHMVSGMRRRRRDSWLRRVSSRIANLVRMSLLGDSVADSGCGLKLIARDAFLSLPFFDHYHRFLPALILRGGGRIATVSVNHRRRRSGKSKYGVRNRLWVGIVDLLGVLWLQRRARVPVVEEDRVS